MTKEFLYNIQQHLAFNFVNVAIIIVDSIEYQKLLEQFIFHCSNILFIYL